MRKDIPQRPLLRVMAGNSVNDTSSHATERRPDLEDLAAYVDQRLDAVGRERVEARLASDEDYYDVFLETVRFQEEEAEAGESHEAKQSRPTTKRLAPRRTASQRGLMKWLAPGALAAAVLVFLLLGPWRQPSNLAAKLDASAVVATEGWDQTGWRVFRSGEPQILESYNRRNLTFRIATQSVLLQIATDAALGKVGDGQHLKTQQAEIQLYRMESLCDALNLFVDARSYQAARERIDDPEALRVEVLRLNKDLTRRVEANRPDALAFAWGRLTATAQLAALTQDAELLRQAVERLSDEVPGTPADEVAGTPALSTAQLTPKERQQLKAHRRALKAQLESERIDFDAAREALRGIVRILAG